MLQKASRCGWLRREMKILILSYVGVESELVAEVW